MKRSADLPANPPPVVGFADYYVGGFVDGFHTHERAQLSVFMAGSVTVTTHEESFVLRPGQALWLPAHTLHQATCRTDLSFQVIYVDPDFPGAGTLPCKMFDASSLIRGLMDEVIAMSFEFAMDSRMLTIAGLLIDEVERAPRLAERVLLPADPRMRRVCEAIIAKPGDCRDIDYWAREAGMARRTFTRLFQSQMGMGFAAWRRDLTGRWSVEATGFANFLSNLQVSATNGAGESLIGTAGTAHSRGVEATAHWKPLNTLQLNAFLGLTYAAYDRFVFGGSDYSGKQMAGTPRSNFGFSGEWHPVPGWTVNASVVRRGRTTLYPSSSIQNAPYILVDAQIEKRWKHWNVALYGHNLTNSSYFTRGLSGGYVVAANPRQLGFRVGVNF